MKKALFVLAIGVLSLLQGCGGGKSSVSLQSEDIEVRHARNLQMEDLGEGVTLVTLRNPWDTTRTMARYALVEKGKKSPEGLPAGTKTITVPIERSVVYSGIHVSLIDELGAGDAVKGLCDANYISDPRTIAALKAGKIADCGKNTAPNMERIVSLRPQVIILSPYESTDEASRFARTGINVIEAADYMENTPLGRAEWMRFFGRLYGQADRADSLFNVIAKDYESLKTKAAAVGKRPSVLFDRLYSGVWNVPTSGSVTGIMIEDAGGLNPFAERKDAGSAHLTAEEVLYDAQNAYIWLIRHMEPELTLAALGKDNPVYRKFKAYKEGNVYGANTLTTRLFEDGAFHPNLILREMLRILHPEVEAGSLEYYKKLH